MNFPGWSPPPIPLAPPNPLAPTLSRSAHAVTPQNSHWIFKDILYSSRFPIHFNKRCMGVFMFMCITTHSKKNPVVREINGQSRGRSLILRQFIQLFSLSLMISTAMFRNGTLQVNGGNLSIWVKSMYSDVFIYMYI